MMPQLISKPFLWLSSPIMVNGSLSNRVALNDLVNDNEQIVKLYCLDTGHQPQMEIKNLITNEIETIQL